MDLLLSSEQVLGEVQEELFFLPFDNQLNLVFPDEDHAQLSSSLHKKKCKLVCQITMG